MAIKGTVTVRTYKGGTIPAVLLLLKQAQQYASYAMHEQAKVLREKAEEILKAGYLATPVVQSNLVVDSPGYGLDLIIQRLIGTLTYSLTVTHGEIGTGTTTPAATDTALETPTNRTPTAFSEDYGANTAVLQFYFPDLVLANTTYTEFGTFVDGSDTIGTGQMFNHALFTSPYIKVAGQDTTVEVDFNLSSS